MFQFPRCPPRTLCIQVRVTNLRRLGSPIRRYPDHRLLPTPRIFSQVTASFIGLKRQGIRHAPFVA
jgi:hypothetical protein